MRGVKKQDLPTKLCATCGKPFTWRKKWAKDWDEVRYCSDRCRTHRHDASQPTGSESRSRRDDA